MKVLLVATVQSHICQFHKPLVEMLHEHEAEVHVAARDNLAEKNGLKLDFVEKVFNLPFSRSPKSFDNVKAYKQLKKIIDEGKYDVVHCNTPMGGIVARLAAKKARKNGTKVYYTAHGFHFYKGASKLSWLVYYPIEKWFAEHYTDKLITIAKEDYATASQKFHTDVYYIHGVGVNEKKFLSVTSEQNEVFRKEQGYDKHFTVLCTGELNKNKNQTVLIQTMPELLKSCPNVLLLLAGNGPEEDNLRRQITDLGMQEYVQLLGYRTDLEKYVNASDLVVAASKREGLGLNVIEAMICGKAIVASTNRGHCELVEDGKTGFLVDASDSLEYMDKITKLYRDKNLRIKMGQDGQQSVKSYVARTVKDELNVVYALN